MNNNKLIAWITGGATGIGLASARRLGSLGYTLIISGRRKDELEKAVNLLTKDGFVATYIQVDITKKAQVKKACDSIIHDFKKIDALVCSAGVNLPNKFWKTINDISIDTIIDTNLKGTTYCISNVLPYMREAKSGTIVVISSWSGRYYTSFTGGLYSASKQALTPLVESINDQEGINGIRASVICSGEVATPILKLRTVPPPQADIERMLKPEDVASAVAYIVQAPSNVCINEVVLSSTYNRAYTGGPDIRGPNNLNP
jgi:NADP-dependent 3-hydroxy acid dehydrogenase YdfG